MVAVDRQDTGPEGGAVDSGKRDRLEVVVVRGRLGELREEKAKGKGTETEEQFRGLPV